MGLARGSAGQVRRVAREAALARQGPQQLRRSSNQTCSALRLGRTFLALEIAVPTVPIKPPGVQGETVTALSRIRSTWSLAVRLEFVEDTPLRSDVFTSSTLSG